MANNKAVLFVCLGNICRSPMAEMVFRHLIKERGCEKEWTVSSCGTAGYHTGEDMDDRSAACCESHGVHAFHKARQLNPDSDFAKYYHILCMDNSNKHNVQYQYNLWMKKHSVKEPVNSIRLLGEYDRDQHKLEVDDPYYGGPDGFDINFAHIKRSCEHFLDSVDSS